MKTKFKVEGMSCMNCVAHVQKAIEGVDGVTSVEVNLKKGEAKVAGEFDAAAVVKAVTDAGYTCKQ